MWLHGPVVNYRQGQGIGASPPQNHNILINMYILIRRTAIYHKFCKYNMIPMHNFTMVATGCYKWLHGQALRTSAGMIAIVGVTAIVHII